MNSSQLNIAVVGAGAAGITAAYILSRKHKVTLFDSNTYVGGHTNTIVIPHGPDSGTPVDTGFIVFNDRTYPLLNELFRQLNVPIRKSDMSFSYFDEKTGFQYSSNVPDGLLAQRSNLFRPKFWKFLGDILKFNERSVRDLRSGMLGRVTMGEYLKAGGYSDLFVQSYILAMGAAIWSTPRGKMLEFPAETFVRFFENHGLLTLKDRPQWYTVTGGSHSYVKAFLKQFHGGVHTHSPVQSIRREPDGVHVHLANHGKYHFDKVVIAAHADEALKMLDDPSKDEKRLLGVWQYSQNDTVLHTDVSVMPPNARAWASWNYVEEKEKGVRPLLEQKGSDPFFPVSVSYDMNRLQGLKTHDRYFVTLNRLTSIPEDKIICKILYTHPTYTFESLASQKELPSLNGVRNTYFCGSYFGYGFHEDAVRSSVNVAKMFGMEL